MKTHIILVTMACGAAALLLGSCTLDPERKLDNAIERYNEKQPKALQTLEEEFINYIAVDSVKGTDVQSSGSVLYRTQDNSADIIYPDRQRYSLTDEDPVTGIDRTDDYAVLTDGVKLCIFEENGDHLNDEIIGDKKNPVRAVLIESDSILYYKNSNLFRYSIIHHSSEQVLKESFPPPYKSYYQVSLSKKDNLLTIVAGIAGSHYLSLVNLSDGSTVLKNLSLSSSKHYMGLNIIRYISGNSGRWELMQYSINSKTKKSLAKLTDIIDIELVSRGYVLESSTGLWTAEYGKDGKRIPFPYKLAGKYKGRVILQHGGTSYFIDMEKLFSGTNKLVEKAPDIFSALKQ